MKRQVVGYHRDERDDWVAELDCGHNQHMRHRPPFEERPWVTTEAGRQGRIGMPVDCVRCNRFEFPEAMVSYRQTQVFDADSTPAGLRRDHSTNQGVWGLIHVLEGEVIYTTPFETFTLTAGEQGIVVPEMKHHVTPGPDARFYVDFYRRDQHVPKS